MSYTLPNTTIIYTTIVTYCAQDREIMSFGTTKGQTKLQGTARHFYVLINKTAKHSHSFSSTHILVNDDQRYPD